MTVRELLVRLRKVRRSGKGWTALCPAHQDGHPSLSITEQGGKILLHCHAGCKPEDVCASLGLEMRDLFSDATATLSIVATYEYRNETGELLYQVVRLFPKDFRQRRPDGRGGWIWDMQGVRRVLYRLAEIVNADREIVVEGEKDVDTLSSMGLKATCNPGGAGKWRPEYNEVLRGKSVAIIADADPPGLNHARHVASSLLGVASSVRLIEALPGAKDTSEWSEKGGTRDRLVGLIKATPALTPADIASWIPGKGVEPQPATLEHTPPANHTPVAPVLRSEALYGLAGEVVNTILPHSEADSATLLLHFLTGYGSIIGRSAYFPVEDTRHYTNLYYLCVGDTSRGRKGTAWGRVHCLLAELDPDWAKARIHSGLSSGEGLISAFEDHDQKITDKRLLVSQADRVCFSLASHQP